MCLSSYTTMVATAGQSEIDMRYGTLVEWPIASKIYKYLVKNVARREWLDRHVYAQAAVRRQVGCTYTRACGVARTTSFTMSPDTPSSRTRQSTTSVACWPTRRRSWRLWHQLRAPIAGWCPDLRHPSTWRTHSATGRRLHRASVYSKSPKAKRVEFRAPDPAANPYLCLPLLMAGLDQCPESDRSGEPMDKDLCYLPAEELGKWKRVPGSLPRY